MRHQRDFVIADVFTTTPFSGNPLAVFPHAEGLGTEAMQKIASEFNLSETVFVFPPASASTTYEIRIFTPRAELPFAGHPTIGTALVLDALGHLPTSDGGAASGSRKIVLGEGIGPVPVSISDDGMVRVAELTSPRIPSKLAFEIPVESAAALMGLDVANIDADLPIAAYSAGVPFLFVPLRDRAVLGRVLLRMDVWTTHLAGTSAPQLFAMVLGKASGHREIDGRMFAPAMGISEDPATGAAAVALGGYLFDNRLHDEGSTRWRIRQGFAMGRPSHLDLEVIVEKNALASVRLAGSAVIVARGVLDVEEGEIGG